ncbi:MAG TPA: hypothetical protein VF821_31290, partial [Lentzea sp.]
MINRRTLAKSAGAALAISATGIASADTTEHSKRGRYLIRGGAVVTVDKTLGVLPRADVLIDNGK